jgi:four helix bundle protein
MQDFRNLSVWQRARRLTKAVYELTVDFPGSEEFGLKSQMRRATVSICSNIAEGCGRRGDREFRRFLDVAMGSACELECETILSFDLAFITEAAQEQILDAVIHIKRMLGGLLSRLGWGRLPDVSRRSRDPEGKLHTKAES